MDCKSKLKTKVAIVLMHFNYGGGERMVSLLASHIDLNHFDVRVFCVYGEPHNNVMEKKITQHGVPITFIRKGLGFSAKSLFRLGKELSKFDPDVVHTHLGASVYCAPWVILNHVKMLHTLHNIPEKESGKIRRSVLRALFKAKIAVPVAISPSNQQLTAVYYGLPDTRVEMIENPVDAEAFFDSNPKSWSSRYYEFIHIARFEEAKNHEALIEAFARLRSSDERFASVRIALVGSGPLEEKIKSLVYELGLSDAVSFLGVRDDISDLLHESKCLVLPSLYEGLPLTVLEAMAAGLPVIASAVGGIPDVVEDGSTGFLFDPHDRDALITAMSTILTKPSLAMDMGRAGKTAVIRYSVESITRKYEHLYIQYGAKG